MSRTEKADKNVTSDLDRIREALEYMAEPWQDGRWEAAQKALALLDGAVGLTRPGDVVLSADEVRQIVGFIPLHRRPESLQRAIALLAPRRPGEEQAGG